MGDTRSIRTVARQLHKSSTLTARWSKKFKWQERLARLADEESARMVAADEAAMMSATQKRELLRDPSYLVKMVTFQGWNVSLGTTGCSSGNHIFSWRDLALELLVLLLCNTSCQ
jgi:hypothetical protein